MLRLDALLLLDLPGVDALPVLEMDVRRDPRSLGSGVVPLELPATGDAAFPDPPKSN